MHEALKYCSFMEDNVEMFFVGAKKIAKIMGLSQKKIAEKIIGVAGLKGTQGSISSYFTGRTRPKEPMPIMKAIAEKALKTTYEEVLKIGREEQTRKNEIKTKTTKEEEKDNIFKINDSLEAEHLSIIRQFKNKDMACEINKKLVELESLNSIAFAKIILEIEKRIDEVKSAKKRTANGED